MSLNAKPQMGRFLSGRFSQGRFDALRHSVKFGGGGPVLGGLSFGARTLAGAGGLNAPAGATAIQGGTAASGYVMDSQQRVVPSADGSAISGTLVFAGSGETWTVTTVPDAFSCISADELKAVVDLGATEISGTSALLRGGDYGLINKSGGAWHNKFNDLTSEFKIASHDPQDRAQIRHFHLYSSDSTTGPKNVTFEDIRFEEDYTAENGGVPYLLGINIHNNGNVTGRAKNIVVRRCSFNWNLPKYGTPGLTYNPKGHPYQYFIDTTTAEYSGLQLGRFGCDTAVIEDCTFEKMFNAMIAIHGTDITIRRNTFSEYWGDFLKGGPTFNGGALSNLLFEDNVMYNCWASAARHPDFFTLAWGGGQQRSGKCDGVTIRRNIMFPGPDAVLSNQDGAISPQFLFLYQLAPSWSHIEYTGQTAAFTQNATVTGGTSGASATINYYDPDPEIPNEGVLRIGSISGTFIDGETLTDNQGGTAIAKGTISVGLRDRDKTLYSYDNFLIEGNLIYTNSTHGITTSMTMRNSVVRSNTLLPWREKFLVEGDATGTQPIMQIRGENTLVHQNICGGVSLDYYGDGARAGKVYAGTGCIAAANHTDGLSPADEAGFAALFDGSDWAPVSVEDAISQARMRPQGPLDADSSGAPSQGDIGAVGSTESNGFADFEADTVNPEILMDFDLIIANALDELEGDTDATGSITVFGTGGTLYWVMSESNISPTPAQIVAGTDHTDAAGGASGSQPVSAAGLQNIAASGLGAKRNYFTHFVYENSGQFSNVATSDGFATVGGYTNVLHKSADFARHVVSTPNDLDSENPWFVSGGGSVVSISDDWFRFSKGSGNAYVYQDNLAGRSGFEIPSEAGRWCLVVEMRNTTGPGYPDNGHEVKLWGFGAGEHKGVSVNLSTGTVSPGTNNPAPTDFGIVPLGGGAYRVAVFVDKQAGSTRFIAEVISKSLSATNGEVEIRRAMLCQYDGDNTDIPSWIPGPS